MPATAKGVSRVPTARVAAAAPRQPHRHERFGTVRPVLGRRESRPALALTAVCAFLVAALPAGIGAGATGQATNLRGQQASLESRSRAAVLGLYSLDTQLVRA